MTGKTAIEKETLTADSLSQVGNIRPAEPSPDDASMLRVEHATVSVELETSPGTYFNAFSRWAGYEYWAPEVQGAGH